MQREIVTLRTFIRGLALISSLLLLCAIGVFAAAFVGALDSRPIRPRGGA
jgi:hypothetical protein